MNKRDNLQHMIRMEHALTYMIRNIQKKLRIEDVALAEGVAFKPLYFKDVFREYFDMAWKDYYIKLKMRAAARYVQYERITLNLAIKFGYSDRRSFSKAFKREIGMTPEEFLMKDGTVPDMPDRKQLCGVPIQLELVKKDEFCVCGIPLYNHEKGRTFDRLEDAAYALTCLSAWKSQLPGRTHIGIWSYDEQGEQFYLIGAKADPTQVAPEGMIRQDIGAGQYAVFSAERTEDNEKNAEICRMIARYALKEWRYVNFKETNRLGYTFEVFDDKRLYLYVPLLGNYGNNEHWRTSMQASLYREYIDSHITEEIKTSEYARQVYYTERWLRDSFKNLHGITPRKYIDSRRLKLAARELRQEDCDKSAILKKYHFTSMAVFARKFINMYGLSYEDYKEPVISLPETLPVYYGSERRIKVTITDLPAIKVKLHPLSTVPDNLDVGDYPGIIIYWFTHEWSQEYSVFAPKSAEGTDKIFLYDIHLFEKSQASKDHFIIGMVVDEDAMASKNPSTQKEDIREGYQEKILAGGSYAVFEMEGDYDQRDLLEVYQQMESSILQKWYYESQMIVNTTKEKLIRYKNGKLQFLIPLEI